MGETDLRSYELSQLQAEVEQEREVKEMLKDSVSDLRSTLADLEKRLHSVDGEENEWRTRYETQLELNEQLEKHLRVVRERLETLRGDPADRLASIRSYDQMSEAIQDVDEFLSSEQIGRNPALLRLLTSGSSAVNGCRQNESPNSLHHNDPQDSVHQLTFCEDKICMIDALKQRLKLLSTEKCGLQSQLKDFQMRIVQEGKTYQKVHEERRAYLAEIAKLSSTLDMSRKQQMVQARRTALGPDKTRGQESKSRLPRLKH